MAYSAITSSEITTGEPVSNTTQTKIKNNLEDHESRILDLENGGAIEYPPIILKVDGSYSYLTVPTTTLRLCETTINFNLRVTGVRLIVGHAGSSGTTEIDVLYSRSGGPYTSILTTKPTVAHSSGSGAVSSNAVIDSDKRDLQAGDLIKINITSAQTEGYGLIVRIDYEKL